MKEVKQHVPKYKIPLHFRKRLQAYDDEDFGEDAYARAFAGLNSQAIVIATEMASDMLSGSIRPDSHLATDLGLDRSVITKYRNNPLFNQALATLAMGVVRGKVMVYVNMIEKHAEKNWQAAKFLMEWVGLFIPKSQHLNLNVSATDSQTVFESSDDAIHAFIQRLKALGWSLERIAEIYNAD